MEKTDALRVAERRRLKPGRYRQLICFPKPQPKLEDLDKAEKLQFLRDLLFGRRCPDRVRL